MVESSGRLARLQGLIGVCETLFFGFTGLGFRVEVQGLRLSIFFEGGYTGLMRFCSIFTGLYRAFRDSDSG